MSCDVLLQKDFTAKPKILIYSSSIHHRTLHIHDYSGFPKAMNMRNGQQSNKANRPKTKKQNGEPHYKTFRPIDRNAVMPFIL